MRTLAALLLAVVAFAGHPTIAQADVQSDINAACLTGGTVQMPPAVTVTTTLNLVCDPGTTPLTLKGAPTVITCQTGAAPCLKVGSNAADNGSRLNLKVRDVHLVGPGRAVVGSEGIRVLPTADDSAFDGLKIDGFEKGMRLIGGDILLIGVRVSNSDISSIWNPSVDTAVHLDGRVANIYFTSFALNGWRRVILSDGPGGTGASASFTHGRLNSTWNPGTAAVYVESSDGVAHELLLSDIEDWETACPYVEIGHGGRVAINGVAFWSDPQQSGIRPGIIVGNTPTAVSWLRMSNVNVTHCSGEGNLVTVNSPSTFTTITGSDLTGRVQFNAAGQASFTGNRFLGSSCLNGTLTGVRAAANVNCADR